LKQTSGGAVLTSHMSLKLIWRDLKVRCSFAVKQHTFRTPKQWLFDRLMECTDTEASYNTIILPISFWHKYMGVQECHIRNRTVKGEFIPDKAVEKILAYVDMVSFAASIFTHNLHNRC
jgi:hypothetical protein